MQLQSLRNIVSQLVLVACFFTALAAAVPMTIKLAASERQCFYTEVTRAGAKVDFSFAVQSGGAFDIGLTIKSPTGQIEYDETKEKQGDFSFAAARGGEYEFCFSNDMSTFAGKSVEFDVQTTNDYEAEAGVYAPTLRAELPVNIAAEGADKVEGFVSNLEASSSQLLKTLRYYKTRNNRNESTVQSTESRIFWFSVLDCVLMVGMAALQVIIVQLFFTGCKYSPASTFITGTNYLQLAKILYKHSHLDIW